MIVDIECDIPTREAREADLANLNAEDPGMANYVNIFGTQWADEAGMPREEFEALKVELPPMQLRRAIAARAVDNAPTEAEFIASLDAAGITVACIGTGRHASAEHTFDLADRHPDRFIPWARINAHEQEAGATRLERMVKERGLRGLEISCFRDRAYANDPRYYPVYAKCVELGIPARVYCTMSYASDRPMDLGRPLYLDRVCVDFPDLTVIAGLGGWPWVPELVGAARRHANLYIDLAAHRPRNLPKPGSGWEMMLQFGNTLLQDKMLFASSWMTLGMTPAEVVAEYDELPLRDSVRPKWMGANAARLLGLQ
ncbi:MAG: amidohydrolase family protein [Pseudomonadales bacterium]